MGTTYTTSALDKLKSEVPHLNRLTSTLVGETQSDLVTIRWIQTKEHSSPRVAHLLDYASRFKVDLSDEKCLSCYGVFNPLTNWGALSCPVGIQAENEVDKRLYTSIRQKATFPIAVDSEVALLVNLLRVEDGPSQMDGAPYSYREVQNAWTNTQAVMSSQFLVDSQIHASFWEALRQIGKLRTTGDLDRFLLGMAQCVTSGNGFAWNRAFIFDASKDRKRCKVALGQTTNQSWLRAVESRPSSLTAELAKTVDSSVPLEKTIFGLQDSLAKVCSASSEFDFEAPHATPELKDRTPPGWLSSLNSDPSPTEINEELRRKCGECLVDYDNCSSIKSQAFVVSSNPYLLVVCDCYGSSEDDLSNGVARDILTSVFVKQAAEACSEMLEGQSLEARLSTDVETEGRENSWARD